MKMKMCPLYGKGDDCTKICPKNTDAQCRIGWKVRNYTAKHRDPNYDFYYDPPRLIKKKEKK